jgi:DNA-binding NtrC family response regulator
LENAVERAAILADDVVMAEHFPFAGSFAGVKTAVSTLKMRDLERRAIEQALKRHEGNRTHAAKELGISLRTLQYRLKEYGLSDH